MQDFHAEEWFEMKGRGWVAAAKAPRQYDREGVFQEIAAEGFTIDGRSYTLLGVERRLPNSPIHIGEMVGLLVKEAPPVNRPETGRCEECGGAGGYYDGNDEWHACPECGGNL